jgi:hypothetical protein
VSVLPVGEVVTGSAWTVRVSQVSQRMLEAVGAVAADSIAFLGCCRICLTRYLSLWGKLERTEATTTE